MTAMSLINESMYPTNAATLSEASTRTPSVLSDELRRQQDEVLHHRDQSSSSSSQISSANTGILISQRYATTASASSTNNSFVNPLSDSSITSANNNRSVGLASERGKNTSSSSTGRRVRFVGFDDDEDDKEQGVKSEEV